MENKKQFAFSVAIEKFNEETIEFMKKVGYKSYFKQDIIYNTATNLVNDFYEHNGQYWIVGNPTITRILCNWQTEPELCKALLAATVGGMVYDEEWIIGLNGAFGKAGYYINKDISDYPHLRKPQSEELINHFRKQMQSTEPRKIKGYPAPFDMKYSGTKKGDLFIEDNDNPLRYHHGCFVLPKEIVEKYFEPEYEESVEDKLRVILNKMGSQDEVIEKIKQLFTNNSK